MDVSEEDQDNSAANTFMLATTRRQAKGDTSRPQPIRRFGIDDNPYKNVQNSETNTLPLAVNDDPTTTVTKTRSKGRKRKYNSSLQLSTEPSTPQIPVDSTSEDVLVQQ
jgi:hypothetical protein